MNFPFYIARRYLISKKSHNAINIISAISVVGVAVATAAMVCIMSVFNGFQDMIANLFTAFDPQIKVVATQGKYMDAHSPELTRVKEHSSVAVCSETLELPALLNTGTRQVVATVKGVDDNFEQLIDFKRIRYGDGTFELHADVIQYGIFGVNLLSSLGLGADFPSPIQVYAPRGGERIDPTDPSESFNQDELYSPHVAFCVKQGKYDSNYVITSLKFAQDIFERKNQITSLEIKLKDGISTSKAKKEFASMLGPAYTILDQYEQQADTFKIMKIEKLISYIFLTFILMIACFNIIGSLSMLIIDKQTDIQALRNLGATRRQVASIFMTEGRMISLLGAVAGIAAGLALCFLQQQYGIIKFGQSAGSYIIDSYPVSVKATDIIIIFATVVVVGFISVWYPVHQLTKRLVNSKLLALLAMAVPTLTACGPDSDTFTIKGKFDDMPAGQLYIYNMTPGLETFDTIYINGGKFTYSASSPEVTPYILVFPNALEQVIFAANGQEIDYRASTKDLKNYTANGNNENKLMNEFRNETKDLSGVQIQEMARQFILQNLTSPVATYLFSRYYMQETATDAEECTQIINQLIEAQPDNPFIRHAAETWQRLNATGTTGSKMPDSLVIKTRTQEKLNLSNLAATHTVLVFWASWMPRIYDFIDNLNIIIEEYGQDDNMQFIAISLDTEKYRWQERIKQDTILCEQSCDLKAWESPVVTALGVTDVPSFIVIKGKDHTVAARGKTLDEMEKIIANL
ncbi:MAG: FtsX-like permease family protein [Bacteroidaceae bacterium]|nr:FtsX-like permease family protein [Bacteroidaceae bacterium]